MKLKQLFTDDSAVSPVIGVILMVAITVILAAVIGSFVLNLGGSLQQSSPQASFGLNYDAGSDGSFSGADGEDSVTITHETGDSIEAARLTVSIAGTDATTLTWDTNSGFSGTVQAGSTATFTEDSANDNLSPNDDVRVVWESDDGSSSATLAESSVPS